MRKPKLAIFLSLSVVVAMAIETAVFVIFAKTHFPPISVLASFAAFIPAVVIAGLAWTGKLPSNCRPVKTAYQ